MKQTYKIAPSILSADLARLGDDVAKVIDAGDDTFVAGTAIFKSADYQKTIDKMRQELAQ